MASRGFAKPLQSLPYICNSCLSSTRTRRTSRILAFQPFSTAPLRTNRSIPRHPASQRPQNAIPLKRSVIWRPTVTPQYFSTESSAPNAVVGGIAPLPHRRLIGLSGPDTAKFLQGLITNNVDSTRLSPFYSAFLDARGRMLWDVFVWVWPQLVAEQGHWGCFIEVDADEAESLKKHLKRHKLRSKIVIKDVPTEGAQGVRVWAAWGGAHEQVKAWPEIAGWEDPRAPGMFRYLANADRDTIADGIQPVDAQYYHVQRYLHGVPEGPVEITRESALPMEMNVDLNGGIDFRKGCYVGQELTIRTKHTGVVRKRVLPVRFHAAESQVTASDTKQSDVTGTQFDPSFEPQPPAGADIKILDDNSVLRKGRAAGKIIAAIGNVGLASCRLENMTPMRVSAEGGTYKAGVQFGVEADGKVVKVEPILCEWFVKRKEALWDKESRSKAVTTKEQDSIEAD